MLDTLLRNVLNNIRPRLEHDYDLKIENKRDDYFEIYNGPYPLGKGYYVTRMSKIHKVDSYVNTVYSMTLREVVTVGYSSNSSVITYVLVTIDSTALSQFNYERSAKADSIINTIINSVDIPVMKTPAQNTLCRFAQEHGFTSIDSLRGYLYKIYNNYDGSLTDEVLAEFIEKDF